ncbi:hypothetical protein ABFS83_03G029800 [Erythranthe nasuta]
MEDSKVEEHKEVRNTVLCDRFSCFSHLISPLDYSYEFTTHEEFATRENLVTWVREVGIRLGMIITVKRPYVVLVCERAGVYRGRKVPGQDDKGKGKRQTWSKKCECPFELKGQKIGMDDEEVGWVLTVECSSHNHSDFENFQGHLYAGRLTSEEMALVEDLSNALVKPKAILSSLKLKNPTNASLIKTVYNARQKIQFKENAGRTQMQFLMMKLSENNYFDYPYVFVMDCTYKTNIYGLPFVEIVDNYVWALKSLAKVMESCPRPNCIVTDRELSLMKAIEIVYPSSQQLLCRWHVSKNILSNCKKMFKTNNDKWKDFESDWASLVDQETEESFHKEWDIMKTNFVDYPDALTYISYSWLDPYKEMIVLAWTNKHRHLGTYTSNRLGNSMGTFVKIWSHIDNLLMHQHTKIKASFEKSKNTYQHSYKVAIYNKLRGCVSLYALEQLKLEFMSCICDIRTTHGLPCAHELHGNVINRTPISLDWIDPYWKHLSMEPMICTKDEHLPTDAEEMEAWRAVFDPSDAKKRVQLLMKLREITHRESNSLIINN